MVDLYAQVDDGFYIIYNFSQVSLPTDELYYSWSEERDFALPNVF